MEKRRRRSTYGDFAQKNTVRSFSNKKINKKGRISFRSREGAPSYNFPWMGHILGLFLGAE